MQQTNSQASDGTTDTSGAAPKGFQEELWEELERAQQLATQVSSWGGTMLSLAWLELRQALHNVPRMLGLALALVPLAGLTWISLSLLLAWIAYAVTEVATVGFLVLFAIQLGSLLLCLSLLKRLKKQSTLPETREQWSLFLQELRHSPEAKSRDTSAANPTEAPRA